ncbi:nucleoside phosphatase family-domain-containing protein [Suillus paluster]|uniref:nucleoside phosphatase family-domain-containing protein n=1 Tax=Suillus paluster TaxID=48578 RepID=UPI001B86CD93|nr:nucleoside phosphatase family-domain-containing protein [Suillus paluster]KAG1728588.1 nucleoside phosphatase family-domain-containing protein [Suillus paluster]
MPPTTSSDPWLAVRRFGIVIDAGSSGSRLQIYSWKDPDVVLSEQGDDVRDKLPKVEKGVQEGEDWIMKVEPGLSTFADNPEGVSEYLAPLLKHARSQIPPSLESETPIFLLATAGMRLLTAVQQARVLSAACKYLKSASSFRIDDESKDGPCGSSVQIITGEEEGLYGWIAVNYLMDGFYGKDKKTTYGFLDMGGASTQIAFEPSDKLSGDKLNLVDVRLRLLGGDEVNHSVFVTTWLGYGTNQARERYVAKTVESFKETVLETSESQSIPDPCLPKDLTLSEILPRIDGSHSTHTLAGTGSFTQCLDRTASLLNKNAPCDTAPCLFNGVHVPAINFASSHFIGVSEYWYSSEHVFGLGGPYDYVQYERAATEFCGRDWSDIVNEHDLSRAQGIQGGDGEVMKNGEVMEVGKWGRNVELPRLRMQCFKAAWIANVLHEGIGIPRIVDPGGNSTTSGEQVAHQAETKGLGRPVFQSADSVGDIAISWTLGKMVLEASKEIKPSSSSSRPLADPIDGIPASTPNPPIKPIRPFWNLDVLEDHVSPHLPTSLTRESLGFSLITMLFYITVLIVVSCIVFRLRHSLRVARRRILRGSFKRDSHGAMEEGVAISGPPSPSSFLPPSILRPLRRLVSSSTPSSRPRLIPITTSLHPPPTRYSQASTRSPPPHYNTSDGFSTSTSTSHTHSRAPSPITATAPDDAGRNSVSSVSSINPRSRNSSHMNLTLLPRQTLSRANSVLQLPDE